MATTPDPFLEALDPAALESTQAAHDDATDPRQNPCPECHTGEVVSTGFPSPAATQAYCSDACGWTA